MISLPSRASYDRAAVARGGLHVFTKLAWHIVEAAKFVDNWHLIEVCAHLEACQRREIRNLILNEPPGCMKSLEVSVFYPAWAWILNPEEKFIYSTYDSGLSEKHARMMRDLIRSTWFQERWGAGTEHGIEIPMSHARKVREFENAARGWRYSTSTGGPVTGRHGDQLIFDDPIKPRETEGGAEKTRVKLDAAHQFWTNTLATRQANPTRTVRIMMMQRLHDDDPCGRELRTGGYEVLMLPMRFEPKRKCTTRWGGDRRTKEGELLWPERFPEVEVKKLEETLGQHAHAQLQQDPVPPGGYFFNLEWLQNTWAILPAMQEMQTIQSWDMRFKDSSTSGDWVVGQVWGRYRGLFFLLDQVRGRWSFSETCQQVVALSQKWPQALTKLIENKANGPAVISTLQLEIPGFEPVEPDGGKESRAAATSPVFKSGNVLVPQAPWVADWRTEMARFPKAPHDDQVDATTQAVLYLLLQGNMLASAMARVSTDKELARLLTG